MTTKGISIGLGRELVLNQKAYELVEKAYDNLNQIGRLKLKGMTYERKKMAYMPNESVPLFNTEGTAPGVKISNNNTMIFLLPGVPQELKSMFINHIYPILEEKKGIYIQKGFIFSNIGESQIAPYITKLKKEYSKLWIKTHPKKGPNVEIELVITCFGDSECEKMVNAILKKIKEIILKLGGNISK